MAKGPKGVLAKRVTGAKALRQEQGGRVRGAARGGRGPAEPGRAGQAEAGKENSIRSFTNALVTVSLFF